MVGEFISDCGEWTVDVNHDGAPDVVTVGWMTDGLWWYENPKKPDVMWQRHLIAHTVETEGGWMADINGDGKPDLALAHYGHAGVMWVDFSGPEPKVHHVGTRDQDGHGIGMADIDGDGKIDILMPHGWFKNIDADHDQWEWRPEWNLGIEPHWHSAAPSLDDTHQRRTARRGGHEVDQRDAAVLRVEDRFEDHGAGTVLPPDADRFVGRGNTPIAVIRGTNQRGETGSTVEARPAQPVDRAIAADQCRGMAIADQSIILDPRRGLGRTRRRWRNVLVVLRLFGLPRAARTRHQVARPQALPCSVEQ